MVHTTCLSGNRRVTHYKTFGPKETPMRWSGLQTTFCHKKPHKKWHGKLCKTTHEIGTQIPAGHSFCVKTDVCQKQALKVVCFLLSSNTTCIRVHIFTYSFMQYALRSSKIYNKKEKHDSKGVVAFILLWRCTTVCTCSRSLPCGCCSSQTSALHSGCLVCWISVRYWGHIREAPVFEQFTHTATASTCEYRATVNFPLICGSCLGAH